MLAQTTHYPSETHVFSLSSLWFILNNLGETAPSTKHSHTVCLQTCAVPLKFTNTIFPSEKQEWASSLINTSRVQTFFWDWAIGVYGWGTVTLENQQDFSSKTLWRRRQHPANMLACVKLHRSVPVKLPFLNKGLHGNKGGKHSY